MASAWKRLWTATSHGSTIWGLLPSSWQTALATGLAATTGLFGYTAGGLFYALIGATAVFAFSMAGGYYAILLRRQTSVFECLTVEAFGLVQANMVGNKETKEMTLSGLTMEAHLRNHSERTMYMKLKRAANSMGDYTAPPQKLADMISIIPPKGLQKINLATLPNIPVKGEALMGNIELEILYGPSKDDLCYLFDYQNAPLLGLAYNLDTGQGMLNMATPIIKHAHERL